MSRVSRSVSVWTDCMISRFWSSLNLSQRARRVPVNPLTPVSGERSSWATVATRSERSRSSRLRARADRSETVTCVTGSLGLRADHPRGDQQLGAVAEPPGLLGLHPPDVQPFVRRGHVVPVTPVEVLEGHHLAQGPAHQVVRRRAADVPGRSRAGRCRRRRRPGPRPAAGRAARRPRSSRSCAEQPEQQHRHADQTRRDRGSRWCSRGCRGSSARDREHRQRQNGWIMFVHWSRRRSP